ncbi:MAG: transporter [Pseudomonadota bacterium]
MSQYIPLILFTVLTNFGSQVMLKHGMTMVGEFNMDAGGLRTAFVDIFFNWYIWGGLVVMGVSMASHLVVLSRVDISYAYPFLGLSFVLIALWGHFMLAESVNMWRVMGILFICLGVSIVAKS